MKPTLALLAASTALATLPLAASAAETEATQAIDAKVLPIAEWNYDDLYTDGVSIDELLDADVLGPTGEEIGDIENVLFSANGEALSVIAEVGGFLDIGDTHVSVPWEDVKIDADADEVVLPVTQETVEDYSLFGERGLLTMAEDAEFQQVEGDGWGTVDTGPRVWRGAELIGDYARLTGGDEPVNYGYVNDLIVKDGKIAAVVVSPDVTWGTPGYYAYPYYGVGYGWGPAYGHYDLPYAQDEIAGLEPFDYEALD